MRGGVCGVWVLVLGLLLLLRRCDLRKRWNKTLGTRRLAEGKTREGQETFSQQNHHAQCPPSIRRSLPVIKLLASLMQKTAAPRYSSGTESLPSMFCVGQSRRRSGYFSKSASTMAVWM